MSNRERFDEISERDHLFNGTVEPLAMLIRVIEELTPWM
jgi:hypothetical protein